jgi:hypothetical protein
MKKRQLDQQKLSELEQLHSINETRKFYQAIKIAKRGFQTRTSMCRKKNGELTCDTSGILARWKEHSEELLSEGAERRSSGTNRKPYETDDDGKDCKRS